MTLHWPQIVYLALVFMGLGIHAAKHGQPQRPHNFWAYSVSAAAVFALLHAGGFFGGGA